MSSTSSTGKRFYKVVDDERPPITIIIVEAFLGPYMRRACYLRVERGSLSEMQIGASTLSRARSWPRWPPHDEGHHDEVHQWFGLWQPPTWPTTAITTAEFIWAEGTLQCFGMFPLGVEELYFGRTFETNEPSSKGKRPQEIMMGEKLMPSVCCNLTPFVFLPWLLAPTALRVLSYKSFAWACAAGWWERPSCALIAAPLELQLCIWSCSDLHCSFRRDFDMASHLGGEPAAWNFRKIHENTGKTETIWCP